MKDILKHINKAFDHRIRLGIMSALMVNESVDFNTLKEILSVTDGNLASHIKGLEKLKYIRIKKQFIGKKPNTEYSVSLIGKKAFQKAFQKHIEALEKLIGKR